MNSENGTVYLIQGQADDEWLRPKPAEAVIMDAIVEGTVLTREDVGHIDSYVDAEALRAVVGSGDDDQLTFAIEDSEVTVTAGGDVTVA